jgi:hypothetical protein
MEVSAAPEVIVACAFFRIWPRRGILDLGSTVGALVTLTG